MADEASISDIKETMKDANATVENKMDEDTNEKTILFAAPGAESLGMKALRLAYWVVSLVVFAVSMFPVCWKIYETGYAFREASDPSRYDDMKETFDGLDLPFITQISSAKHAYRAYFFVIPFVIGLWLVAAKILLEGATPQNPPLVWRKLRGVLHQHLNMPRALVRWLNLPFAVSILDLTVVLCFLTLNILMIWSRTHRSLTRGARKLTFLVEDPGKDPIPGLSWGCAEIMAKTLGVVSIVNIGWYLMLPIGRRSPFLEMMHVSWEQAVKYHRWLGYYTCALVFGHFLLYFIIWAKHTGDDTFNTEGEMVRDGDMLRHNLLVSSCDDGSCSDDQKVLLGSNIFGLISMACMLVMVIFSLDYFRRKRFELFWYIHHLYLPMMFFLCLHYSSAILYLLPGIIGHILDKMLGLAANVNTVKAAASAVSSEILQLRVPTSQKGMVTCKPGQYVFVNAPELSLFQWHPMSVTWASDQELVLHIKALGNWTKALYNAGRSKDTVPLKIDGFYGKDAWNTLCTKNALVLWAGSVGLTYCYGIALKACQEGHTVFFRWIVRSESELQAFQGMLHDLQQRYPASFHCKIWWTMSRTRSGVFPQPAASPISPGFLPDDSGCGFHSKMMPRAFQAIVTSSAILMGLQGYAMAREAVSSKDAASEPNGYVHARFIDMLYATLFASVFIVAVVTLYVCALRFRKPAINKQKETAITHNPVSEGDRNHDDASQSIPVIEGSRPDIVAEFEEIKSALGKTAACEIGVAACGPMAMVSQVQEQCRTSLFDMHKSDFVIDLEDWEW